MPAPFQYSRSLHIPRIFNNLLLYARICISSFKRAVILSVLERRFTTRKMLKRRDEGAPVGCRFERRPFGICTAGFRLRLRAIEEYRRERFFRAARHGWSRKEKSLPDSQDGGLPADSGWFPIMSIRPFSSHPGSPPPACRRWCRRRSAHVGHPVS